jgi:KDO2-lipid IV(A) lauroyltransferase
MNLFLAILVIFFVVLIGLIPFFLLYPISDLISFLLFHIFRYRRDVVEDNIIKSFPRKDTQEQKKIIRKFYSNLSDVLLEGIKAFTMTRKQIIKRHRVVNPEILHPYIEKGMSVIGLPSHYTNWEWGSMSGSLQLEHNNIALYKPINNKWIDRFTRWSRSKYGTELASIYKTIETFERNKNEQVIYIMASDQSPSRGNRAEWIRFLGRDTAFLFGPEKYARRYQYPVFFVDIQRIKRGYYELTLSLITDKPHQLPPGEITRRYAAALEKVIIRKPENWLWSHRRWKLSR